MTKRRLTGPIAALLLIGAHPATAEEPEVAFNTHCRNCHSIKPGDNRLGPSLHNIVGAEAGKVEGFANYSGSLKGLTWDEATLDKFIATPEALAPNTSMKPFGGIKEEAIRKSIIEFLKASKG